MPDVDKYRLKILKTYSIMVEYKGIPSRKNVPSPVENETFKRWQERVLGPNVSDVEVLAPWRPKPQTKMHTIQKWSDLEWPTLIAKEVAQKKNKQQEREVGKAADKVRRMYDDFASDTLEDLVTAMKGDLHPAAEEFLSERLGAGASLDTKELVRSLINAYNSALCELAAKKAELSQQCNRLDRFTLTSG